MKGKGNKRGRGETRQEREEKKGEYSPPILELHSILLSFSYFLDSPILFYYILSCLSFPLYASLLPLHVWVWVWVPVFSFPFNGSTVWHQNMTRRRTDPNDWCLYAVHTFQYSSSPQTTIDCLSLNWSPHKAHTDIKFPLSAFCVISPFLLYDFHTTPILSNLFTISLIPFLPCPSTSSFSSIFIPIHNFTLPLNPSIPPFTSLTHYQSPLCWHFFLFIHLSPYAFNWKLLHSPSFYFLVLTSLLHSLSVLQFFSHMLPYMTMLLHISNWCCPRHIRLLLPLLTLIHWRTVTRTSRSYCVYVWVGDVVCGLPPSFFPLPYMFSSLILLKGLEIVSPFPH